MSAIALIASTITAATPFVLKHNTNVTSATAAMIVLVLISAAVVCAALYGLFGKPSSHKGKKRQQEIINGFRLAGGVLLGFFLMTALVFGAEIAFFGGSPRVSRPVAGLIAVVAFASMALMVQRWANYFAGFVVWGVYNSIIVAMIGHQPSNPSISVSRFYALATGAIYLVSVLPTLRFTKAYTLRLADKMALMAWVLAFTGVVLFPRASLAIMAVGAAALVVAWWLYYSGQRRHSHTALKHDPTTPTPV